MAQNDKLHSKIDQSIAELFEAIQVALLKISPSTSEDRSIDRSATPNPSPPMTHINHLNHGWGRAGIPQPYSGMTRLTKLDFPRFSGVKMKEWFSKVEQFFLMDHTPDEFKVGLASMHFDDLAATWHQSMAESEMEENFLIDWPAYKLLLQERFEELQDDPMAEFKQLQETDGIVEYHGRFELIKTRLKLSEEYLVSTYLTELHVDTQMHVCMFQPTTVRQLGRLYEKAHPKKPTQQSWSQNKNTTSSKGFFPYKKDNEVKPSYPLLTEKPVENKPQPFYQKKRWGRRRAEGLCYFCDENKFRDTT